MFTIGQAQQDGGGEDRLTEPHNLDQALDVLAALLRDYGLYAFDLPESDAQAVRERCEQWAMHVVLATPPPLAGGADKTVSGGKREWGALRAFFHQHRRSEGEYVADSILNMRQVIWTCLHELNRTFQGETRADSRMQAELARLQQAMRSNNLQEIKDEVIATVTTLNRIMEQQRQEHQQRMEALHEHIRELADLLSEARKEGLIDDLTQLYNRKAFNEHLSRTTDMVTIFGQSACLFLIDADRFKTINDTYGHSAGDAALRGIADCLSRSFPGRTDFVARYGGEEFAALCSEMPLSEGRKIAERLLRVASEMKLRYADAEFSVTLSVGLVEARPGEDAAALIDRADRALYLAKQNGRNCYEVG